MISPRLIAVARCPDCRGGLHRTTDAITCAGCGRMFASDCGFLDLRPLTSFAEQTKYLDRDLHLDARHASIAPPVLGSKIRNDMLRSFLAPGPGDRVVDLGCGNGRALAWNADTGAAMLGVDISPYFAREALDRSDLILGDLRRLPLADGAFNKAWSLDVLEHLSPQALQDVLTEAHRVLDDDGALFIYTHVRRNGWPAAGVRAVNRLARACERAGLLDLRQERLRKSDHLNPIADHDELARTVQAGGFRLERVTYYSPVIGAFVENILARAVEHVLARREGRRLPASHDPGAGIRAARASAQARVRRGGLVYWVLRVVTAVMTLDVWLFGRVRSGPFFALLRKNSSRAAAGPGASARVAEPLGSR
jgi:SAM-dependent methyltransferase